MQRSDDERSGGELMLEQRVFAKTGPRCGSSAHRVDLGVRRRESVGGLANPQQHLLATGVLDHIVVVNGTPQLRAGFAQGRRRCQRVWLRCRVDYRQCWRFFGHRIPRPMFAPNYHFFWPPPRPETRRQSFFLAPPPGGGRLQTLRPRVWVTGESHMRFLISVGAVP